jgi:hypothetical protein
LHLVVVIVIAFAPTKVGKLCRTSLIPKIFSFLVTKVRVIKQDLTPKPLRDPKIASQA